MEACCQGKSAILSGGEKLNKRTGLSNVTGFSQTERTWNGLELKTLYSSTGLISPCLLPVNQKRLNLEMRSVLYHNDFLQTIKFMNKNRRADGRAELLESERNYVESAHLMREMRYCIDEKRRCKKIKGHKKHHHSHNKMLRHDKTLKPKYFDIRNVPTSYAVKPLFSTLESRKVACELAINVIESVTGVMVRNCPTYGYANPGKGYFDKICTDHLNYEVDIRKEKSGNIFRTMGDNNQRTLNAVNKKENKLNFPVVMGHERIGQNSKQELIEGIEDACSEDISHTGQSDKAEDTMKLEIMPTVASNHNQASAFSHYIIEPTVHSISSSASSNRNGLLNGVFNSLTSFWNDWLISNPVSVNKRSIHGNNDDIGGIKIPSAKEQQTERLNSTAGSHQLLVTADELDWLGSEPWSSTEEDTVAFQVLGMLHEYLIDGSVPDDSNDRHPLLQTDIPAEFSKKGLTTLLEYLNHHGMPETKDQLLAYLRFAAQVKERDNPKELTTRAAIIASRVLLDQADQAAGLLGDVTRKSLLEISQTLLLRFFPDSHGSLCDVTEIDDEGNELTIEITNLTEQIRRLPSGTELTNDMCDRLKNRFDAKGNEWLLKAALSRMAVEIQYMEPSLQALLYSHIARVDSKTPLTPGEQRGFDIANHVLKKVLLLSEGGELVLSVVTLIDLLTSRPEHCKHMNTGFSQSFDGASLLSDDIQQPLKPLLSKMVTALARSIVRDAQNLSLTGEQLLSRLGLSTDDIQWLNMTKLTDVEQQASQVMGVLLFAESVLQDGGYIDADSRGSRQRRSGIEDVVSSQTEEASSKQFVSGEIDSRKVNRKARILARLQQKGASLSRREREYLLQPRPQPDHFKEMVYNLFHEAKDHGEHQYTYVLDKCGIFDMLNPILQFEDALMTMVNDIAQIVETQHMSEQAKIRLRYHFQQEFVRKMSGKTDWEKFADFARETWKFGPWKVHELRIQIQDKAAGEPISSFSARQIANMKLEKDKWALITGLFAQKQLVDSLMDLEAVIERGSSDVCEYLRDGFMVGISAHALSHDLFADTASDIKVLQELAGAEVKPEEVIAEPTSEKIESLKAEVSQLKTKLRRPALHAKEYRATIQQLLKLDSEIAHEQRVLSSEYSVDKASKTREVVKKHIHHIRSMLYRRGIEEVMNKARTQIGGRHDLHFLAVQEVEQQRVTDSLGITKIVTQRFVDIEGPLAGHYELVETGNSNQYFLKNTGNDDIYPGYFGIDNEGYLHKLPHDGHHLYQEKLKQLIESYPENLIATVKENIQEIKALAEEYSYGNEHNTHDKAVKLYQALKAKGFTMGNGVTVEMTITDVRVPFHYHHSAPTILLGGKECVVDAGVGKHHLGSSHRVIIMSKEDWLQQLSENLGMKKEAIRVVDELTDLSEVARIRCRRAGDGCVLERKDQKERGDDENDQINKNKTMEAKRKVGQRIRAKVLGSLPQLEKKLDAIKARVEGLMDDSRIYTEEEKVDIRNIARRIKERTEIVRKEGIAKGIDLPENFDPEKESEGELIEKCKSWIQEFREQAKDASKKAQDTFYEAHRPGANKDIAGGQSKTSLSGENDRDMVLKPAFPYDYSQIDDRLLSYFDIDMRAAIKEKIDFLISEVSDYSYTSITDGVDKTAALFAGLVDKDFSSKGIISTRLNEEIHQAVKLRYMNVELVVDSGAKCVDSRALGSIVVMEKNDWLKWVKQEESLRLNKKPKKRPASGSSKDIVRIQSRHKKMKEDGVLISDPHYINSSSVYNRFVHRLWRNNGGKILKEIQSSKLKDVTRSEVTEYHGRVEALVENCNSEGVSIESVGGEVVQLEPKEALSFMENFLIDVEAKIREFAIQKRREYASYLRQRKNVKNDSARSSDHQLILQRKREREALFKERIEGALYKKVVSILTRITEEPGGEYYQTVVDLLTDYHEILESRDGSGMKPVEHTVENTPDSLRRIVIIMRDNLAEQKRKANAAARKIIKGDSVSTHDKSVSDRGVPSGSAKTSERRKAKMRQYYKWQAIRGVYDRCKNILEKNVFEISDVRKLAIDYNRKATRRGWEQKSLLSEKASREEMLGLVVSIKRKLESVRKELYENIQPENIDSERIDTSLLDNRESELPRSREYLERLYKEVYSKTFYRLWTSSLQTLEKYTKSLLGNYSENKSNEMHRIIGQINYIRYRGTPEELTTLFDEITVSNDLLSIDDLVDIKEKIDAMKSVAKQNARSDAMKKYNESKKSDVSAVNPLIPQSDHELENSDHGMSDIRGVSGLDAGTAIGEHKIKQEELDLFEAGDGFDFQEPIGSDTVYREELEDVKIQPYQSDQLVLLEDQIKNINLERISKINDLSILSNNLKASLDKVAELRENGFEDDGLQEEVENIKVRIEEAEMCEMNLKVQLLDIFNKKEELCADIRNQELKDRNMSMSVDEISARSYLLKTRRTRKKIWKVLDTKYDNIGLLRKRLAILKKIESSSTGALPVEVIVSGETIRLKDIIKTGDDNIRNTLSLEKATIKSDIESLRVDIRKTENRFSIIMDNEMAAIRNLQAKRLSSEVALD